MILRTLAALVLLSSCPRHEPQLGTVPPNLAERVDGLSFVCAGEWPDDNFLKHSFAEFEDARVRIPIDRDHSFRSIVITRSDPS